MNGVLANGPTWPSRAPLTLATLRCRGSGVRWKWQLVVATLNVAGTDLLPTEIH